MKKVTLFTTGLMLLMAFTVTAQVNILGGVQGGSYDKLINEMNEALGKVEREGKTLSMDNVTLSDSKGSFYNYVHLKGGDNHLALMQFDVLQYQRGKDLDAGTEDANHYKILMPFGNEEIHIFMNRESDPEDVVHNLQDLKNLMQEEKKTPKIADNKKDKKENKPKKEKNRRLRVSVGSNMQGTNMTAANLKEKLGLEWYEQKLDFNHSWKELIKGKIDVLIFVGSAPVEALRKISPEVTEKIKMIGIAADEELEKMYTPSVISSTTYSWLEEDIQTYAVPTVLVAYSKDESEAEKQLLLNFLTVLHEKLPEIKEDRFKYHATWQKVNPLTELTTPEAFQAAYPFIPIWMYHEATFDFVKKQK